MRTFTEYERLLIFWGVCIPTRVQLALLPESTLKRLFAVTVASRWILGYEQKTRGFFGGNAWWAEQRKYHGILWMLYALTGEQAYLLSDALFGGLNWVYHKIVNKPNLMV